jgi:hypothetical protein
MDWIRILASRCAALFGKRKLDADLVYYCNTIVRDIDLAAQRSTAVDRWAQPLTQQQTCKGCPDNAL